MSGSDSAPKSKFAKAKPSLTNGKASGRKSSTNTYSLTHPTILKLNEKSNRGQWCVTEVLYDPGKRFNAEAVTPGKGKPTYHPKPKYLCWINFANKEDLDRTYFSYAMQLKDGTFRTLTWVQEKRVLAALSYRNGIRIMQDKSGLDTERVKAYGNRLPRVGVLAGADQPLHHVGFLSDRHAIKELELQSYEELRASDELLYGETKPYIPKYLAGLTTGVEEENDEIDVAEDDSEDEEEQDEEEDVPDEEDEEQDEDVMEVDEVAAEEEESDGNESEQLEPVNPNKESLAVSRAMRGSKFEQIRDTVSKTDMLVRQEQLAVEDSGNRAVQRGRNTNMSEAPKQPAKKRKNENTKQSAPKKQKAVPSAPKPKKSKSPPKKPAEPKKTSPKKSSPSRKSASPKRPAEPKKKTASKAKPAAPVKAPAAAAASVVSYHKFYTTADKIAEGREKVMSNEKALLAFTDPARAAVLQEETRLSDLLKGKADPATLGVVVPFLYELFCKHYDLPVPDPRTALQGTSKMQQLSAELSACSHWQEAIHIANTIIDSAKKEKEEERKSMPLIALVDEAVQRRDEESLQILHTLVLAEQATIKVGIEALGSDTAGEYLDTLKNIELQKDLFNILNAFLDYVKPDDGEKSEQASPPEEEFNMFD